MAQTKNTNRITVAQVSLLKKKHGMESMTEEEKEAYEKLQKKFKLVPKKEQKGKISGKPADSENIVSHAIGIVKQPIYAKTFAISAILSGILYTFLYGLWKIPVIDFGFNRFSAIGVLDYAYLLLITAITGLMFALFKFERNQSIKSGSKFIGGGFTAGIVSAICPVCQGITITALGGTIAALPLAFLVPYIGLIQLMTVLILGFALYLKANSVYTQTCITCKVPKRKHLSLSASIDIN